MVMLFTAVVVPNHAIYPGFFPYAPPAVPFPYVPFQRSLPAPPLFAYSVHTALPTSVPSSPPPSVPQRAAASEVRSFYSTTDNTFQGYSYQTQYEDGGKSEVVFAVGPEAEQIMKKSLEFIDSIIPKDFGRQFNANETDSTNSSSSAVPRIYPNNAFTFFNPNPFFPNLISSFVNTIVSDNANTNTNATQVAEEAQESMIHGDIAASPSPNESINSISNSDETVDSRSSASETSTTIDSIAVSGTTTTAAENTENSAISATTIASVPTTTISDSMVSPTTTASSTISQITTMASSAVSEDENNDTTRTTEVTISVESSPDSTTTTATTAAASGSETTTEGVTETTSA